MVHSVTSPISLSNAKWSLTSDQLCPSFAPAPFSMSLQHCVGLSLSCMKERIPTRSSVFLRILTSTDSSRLIHDISPGTNLHRNTAIRRGLLKSLNITRSSQTSVARCDLGQGACRKKGLYRAQLVRRPILSWRPLPSGPRPTLQTPERLNGILQLYAELLLIYRLIPVRLFAGGANINQSP